ncbi:hypothetical protein JRQ81_001980 [Phrynocephalus forsythii]|uniref:Uncharacterized protein n=1 Tax=Phrynocephalus forsythii TaxID=171643 RepID=A0A9Q0Y894_9SAUR|nr:hypothetical protein JRQ81_001980 [Phrynocephalus forsythii]
MANNVYLSLRLVQHDWIAFLIGVCYSSWSYVPNWGDQKDVWRRCKIKEKLEVLFILRLSVTSMEALYTSLQNEIQSFEEHIRHCHQAFDIHTFVNVLQLSFPEDGGIEDIQSVEQLQKLVESRKRGGQVIVTTAHARCNIALYIAWFVSYIKYLSSLKDMFDDKVVFPLCENLYVNDDVRGRREGPGYHTTKSIAHTAKQLFAVRRKWAWLLKREVIDEKAFSPQSLISLRGFTNIQPFVKVIRLVPDLFHKSLATAALARRWVELHAEQHNVQPTHLDASSAGKSKCMGPASLKQGYNVPTCAHELSKSQPDLVEIQAKDRSSDDGSTCIRTTNQERNKLREIHEELMPLLWREQRSWTLEAEIQEVNLRISNLQLQQEAMKQELEALSQQLEADNWSVPVRECQALRSKVDALGKQLKLEQYHKSILLGDWLLELEIRPILLQPIHRLQEHYQELVKLFQRRKEICQDLPAANGMD